MQRTQMQRASSRVYSTGANSRHQGDGLPHCYFELLGVYCPGAICVKKIKGFPAQQTVNGCETCPKAT